MIIAALASHEGTTLQAIVNACNVGTLDIQVGIVISNNSDSGALRRANAAGIKCSHMSGRTHPTFEALDNAIADAVREAKADLIFLAGYMKKLGPRTLREYSGRILNTHPALLPKYGGNGMYGMNVHRAVLEAHETVSGASVHVVEAEYDTGPVIAQSTVAVVPDDTPEALAERVQTCERALVVDVLNRIVRGEIVLPIRSA